MQNCFEKLFKCLGKNISGGVLSSGIDLNKICEIRVTVNKKPFIVTDNKIFEIKTGCVSLQEIQNIFASLCEFSVHAFRNEICEGFVTSEGGIRTGICGTAVYENEKIIGIKDISALNIRIPHEINGCSKKLWEYPNCSFLIIGPPCSGKTTLLRDYSKYASLKKRVCIVDERMEIAGTFRGIPSFDIGSSVILNGFIKKDGIKIAVRSMAPDIIICDEFGDEKDISSALFAMKSGTEIVASMHALNEKDFVTKPLTQEIIKYSIFNNFVFINKKHEIYKIVTAKELAI
ncbi:MAG: Flp pilus assembly complex ATPase component TadA [Oscillospiraceae bacterium]|nr:Flp pilus assembly complex ATPase component TadA [Oscillospiraceae bacterium]